MNVPQCSSDRGVHSWRLVRLGWTRGYVLLCSRCGWEL